MCTKPSPQLHELHVQAFHPNTLAGELALCPSQLHSKYQASLSETNKPILINTEKTLLLSGISTKKLFINFMSLCGFCVAGGEEGQVSMPWCLWKAEDSTWESVHVFYHVGPRGQTLV